MISDGTFRAVALSVELGFTSNGHEQVAILWQLQEGHVGEKLAWYGYFTEKGTNIALKGLRAAGWKGDDLSDLSSIIGSEALLVIQNEEYDGKMRPKVRFINRLGGPVIKDTMDQGAAKKFAARMKGAIKAFDIAESQPKVSGKPVAAAKGQAKRPSNDDETDSTIPF